MGSSYILPKLLYISLYTLHGSAIGYIAIFYAEAIRRTPQEIGVLLATPYFVQIVSSPLWTMVADKYPSFQGRLMSFLTLLGGSSVMCLLLLANNMTRYSDTTIFWFALGLALMYSFFGAPLVALVDSAVLKILGDEKILYGDQRLWGSASSGICIFVVGIMVSTVGIQSSFDLFGIGMVLLLGFCLMIRFDTNLEQQPLLGKSEVRGNYAYNPQQASSGDTIEEDRQSRRSSIISQQHQPQDQVTFRRDSVASRTNTLLLSDEEDSRHPLLHTITTTTWAAMDAQHEASQVISNLGQEDYPSIGLVLSHIPTVETSLAAFGLDRTSTALKSFRVQSYLLMILFFALGYSMISQFLFLIYRNDLGMNPSLMGLTGPLGGCAEVLTFWLSKKLFDRYSVTTLTTAAHLLFVFRNIIFMVLKHNDPISIITALGLQVINGFCYAIIWSTAVAEVDTFFPEDQRAMAQGILAAIFSGFGYGLGCVISGVIYDQYGCTFLLGASAGISLLGLGIFFVGRSNQV
ncbi:major facilitator superfamily domain-containing protein [Chlamydoabsidia padenii]|nr:major facilitator superfamily domain-containing protein [Chlamydoabsidia padenii]